MGAGTSGRSSESSAGGSVSSLTSISDSVTPANGGAPLSISYRITPSA